MKSLASAVFGKPIPSQLKICAGYSVHVAETGAAAMGIIGQGGVDAVLLDHKLPDAAGLELLETIAAKYPDLPVVMVTGRWITLSDISHMTPVWHLCLEESVCDPVKIVKSGSRSRGSRRFSSPAHPFSRRVLLKTRIFHSPFPF
jgi:hypothetical protein